MEICPEISEMNGDVAVAKMEEVPEELEEKCKEAAESPEPDGRKEIQRGSP